MMPRPPEQHAGSTAVSLVVAACLLAGCAIQPISPGQAIEVRVEADDPAWRGPLECQASNLAGAWPFTAPGTVTVQPRDSVLQITCRTPAGAAAESIAAAPSAAQEGARKGAVTGAKVGAGAGVALGVAAAPILGPGIAVLMVVGSAFRGAEIGGIVGAVKAGDRPVYPSPIVVHIRRVAPAH